MPHDHAGTPGPIAPDWRTNGARIVKAGVGASTEVAGPRANEPNVGRIDV